MLYNNFIVLFLFIFSYSFLSVMHPAKFPLAFPYILKNFGFVTQLIVLFLKELKNFNLFCCQTCISCYATPFSLF